jgi:hypothetical protein
MSAELSYFILRSQSLSLYRKYLREIRVLPQDKKGKRMHLILQFTERLRTFSTCFLAAGELHSEIRHSFEQNRYVRDLYAIKYNLSDGRTRLGQLQTMVAFTK